MTGHQAAGISLGQLAPLEPDHPLPLYAQVAERLSTAIVRRRQALVGTILPGELELMRHFGVSRPTVRQAMVQLSHGGLVTRSRGKGTFVAPVRFSHNVSLAFEDEMRAACKSVRFEVLSRETVMPGSKVQAALDIRPSEAVERIERLRFLDDQPFAFEQRILPARIAAAITRPMLERLAIISLLAEVAQRPARIRNTVRCMAGEARITTLLGLRPRTPLMLTEHVYYNASGRPMLHGTVRFRWNLVEFTMEADIQGETRAAGKA